MGKDDALVLEAMRKRAEAKMKCANCGCPKGVHGLLNAEPVCLGEFGPCNCPGYKEAE